jgi:hypothetical protein
MHEIQLACTYIVCDRRTCRWTCGQENQWKCRASTISEHACVLAQLARPPSKIIIVLSICDSPALGQYTARTAGIPVSSVSSVLHVTSARQERKRWTVVVKVRTWIGSSTPTLQDVTCDYKLRANTLGCQNFSS